MVKSIPEPTENQRKVLSEMKDKVRQLKAIGYSDKQLEKLISSLNLPLGAELNLKQLTE